MVLKLLSRDLRCKDGFRLSRGNQKNNQTSHGVSAFIMTLVTCHKRHKIVFKILHNTKAPFQYLQSMYKTSREKNNLLEN